MAWDISLSSPGTGFDITLTTVQAFTHNPSETVTTSETITREWTIDFKPTDNPVTSEIISKDVSTPFEDNQTTSEDIAKTIGKEALNADFAIIQVDLSEVLSKDISPILSDNVTNSEVFELIFGLSLLDNLVATELLSVTVTKELSDNISITEIFSYQHTIIRYQVITRETSDSNPIIYNKNTTLTANEVDANFNNLNLYKIERVISSITSGASLTPASTDNLYDITALAVDATINEPSGTPTDGMRLVIKVKDNGTARALTWNAIFRGIGFTLPTTTVVGSPTYAGAIYNGSDAKWDVIAKV